ncbi:hypothetical protein ACVBE9_08595 [Eionea flava]
MIVVYFSCLTQRITHSIVLYAYLLLFALPQQAIAETNDSQDEQIKQKRLWLPISYQQYYPEMLTAADKAHNNDYCYQFIDGSLNESESSMRNIIFTFRCRTQERRLFTLNVNAHTLHVTNSLEEWIKQKKIEEELERQAELLKEKLRKEKEKEQYWGICEEVFTRKANLFTNAKVISEMPPEPDVNEVGEYIYYIEFQTLSSKKTVLNYLATASIHNLEKCNVSIRPL